MAQRVVTCPNCSASVEVPDNYFRATLACLSCGSPVRVPGQQQTAPWEHKPAARPEPQPRPPQQPQPPQQQYRPQAAAQPFQPQPAQYAGAQRAPQPQPQPAGQPYPGGAPAYPAQYAAQYGAYTPPRRSRAWMLALIIPAVIVVGILGLAAIPLITSSGVSGEDVAEWQLYES
jgi:hypothetical protein